MAFASWWYKTHVNEKTSGSSSKPGEKKSTDEKRVTSYGSSQFSRTYVGPTLVSKVSTSFASTSRFSSMNSTQPKAPPTSQQMEEPRTPSKKRHKKQAVKTEPEKKSQSTKPSVVHEKKPKEIEEKEHKEPKHTADTGGIQAPPGKAASRSSEQLPPEKSTKPKVKSQDTPTAVRNTTVAVASGKTDDKKKENKSTTSVGPVEPTPSEPSGKSGMDAALDDLISTLGEPEETAEENSPYTGPEVLDPMTAKYIEELGKREVTIPPKYRELLNKTEGVAGPPPDSTTPMGPEEAIDELSSDFTCSPTAGDQKAKEEKPSGEVLKAQSAKVIKSAAPPHEKKRKVEKEAMSDQALDALSASLGSRKSDPELDLSSLKEVAEAKAKEEKLKKCGEEDETVPSEYRLKAATDKDGKPLLPEPEEKPKPLSESELIDELSADFHTSKQKEEKSKPIEKTKEPQASAPTPVVEKVSRASLCSIQSVPAKPATHSGSQMSEEAVDVLAGSLSKREAEPEDSEPAEDRVKEKAKEEDREKLGEKEETIPPEYRLEEVKDEDGKAAQTSESRKSLPPMTEDFLLDALSKDFDGSSTNTPLNLDEAKLAAVVSEKVSKTPAPTTHSAGPPPSQSDNKELNDALDQLSDSLGERQPDPDDNKPMEDKVKERAKAEHRDKLGERDDTIPPEYRHLLDNNDENKPGKPPKKSPAPKKPTSDQDAIDTLSGDFDSCSTTTETSENVAKDKDKKAGSHSKSSKHGSKAKNSSKTKEETPKPKADDKNTS
ncbi:calpastatin [Suncus etruscus]|uniref:calpastatin n=1 Tax=Suncus etruscus TaxID=109475 RepID=UPI00210FFC56|nr:calpastatin [Suncus etruscus]